MISCEERATGNKKEKPRRSKKRKCKRKENREEPTIHCSESSETATYSVLDGQT